MRRAETTVDYGVLVDIISNVAGMMILLACVALLVSQRLPSERAQHLEAKPIHYPLAYLPDKRSLTFCLRYGKLYELPDRALLEEVSRRAGAGRPVTWLELEQGGVAARLSTVPTATGFRFQYRLLASGGLPLSDKGQLIELINRRLVQHPPDKFFFVFHVWPEHFGDFRDLREYLLERGVEVGWTGRAEDGGRREYDLVYAIGEYDESLSSIKAQ